jgi:Peptidase family M20/M25/M40
LWRTSAKSNPDVDLAYPGRDPKLKAILLLAHIDVVEAKREDWTRDPFKLVEENGSFYARGASDDCEVAARRPRVLVPAGQDLRAAKIANQRVG